MRLRIIPQLVNLTPIWLISLLTSSGDKIAVIRNAFGELSDSNLDPEDNVAISDQFALSSFRPVTSTDILQIIGRSTINSCPLDPVPAAVRENAF